MLSATSESSDVELITAVRGGDTEAYGVLFERHRLAATRLAGHLVPGPDADDLVSESFIRVLGVLRDGRGPDEFFRAYLLSSIRRLHLDRIRSGKRVRTTDDEAELDRAVEFVDPATMRFEHGAAAAAFGSLPERWQLVLWHLDVEGQKPAAIAPMLGMSANSVSALAYRAREGLRQAYLQGHLAPALHEGCRRTTGQLGAYVRKGLSKRDAHAVEDHLDGCSRCTGLHLELSEVNANLSGILGPAILGTAATGYLAAAAATGISTAVGITAAASQVARVAALPVKAVTAGAAGVAGAGAQGVVAVTVVAGLATAGTVAVATDFAGLTAPDSAVVSPQSGALPEPSVETPGLVELEPGLEAEAEPTPEPTLEPTPQPTETLDPVEPESPLPDTEPSPEESDETPPPPPPPPPGPTDYGIATLRITADDALLQHRYTMGITAASDATAIAREVTVTMAFRHSTIFRGVVSEGWTCGNAVRNQRLTTLACRKTLAAGEGTTFIVKARGLAQSGTVTVTATEDPNAANNSRAFRAGPWLPLG